MKVHWDSSNLYWGEYGCILLSESNFITALLKDCDLAHAEYSLKCLILGCMNAD